jgi:hypothetical protein
MVLPSAIGTGRKMTGRTNSKHAWPDDGVTRVPYFVYEDADLYRLAQGAQMLFRKRTVILDSTRIDTLLVIPL